MTTITDRRKMHLGILERSGEGHVNVPELVEDIKRSGKGGIKLSLSAELVCY
jgi:hypothetical protein